jgi:hypothetical protein
MNNPFVRTVVCALAVGSAAAIAWAAPEGRPCSTEPTDMLIAYGDVVTCEIAPVGDLDLFRFEGHVGEKVVAQAARHGGGYGACVELRGPAPGDQLVAGPACGPWPRLDVVLPASGLFTLRVSEVGNDEILPYALTLERVAPPSPGAREVCRNCTVTDMLDPIGDLDAFSFTGAAGDEVVIQATEQGAASTHVCVELFGPASEHARTCGAIARLDLRLAEAGVHTILISPFPFIDQVLGYALYFECFGTCGPPPSTDFYTVTPCRVFDTREPSGPTLGAPLTCGTVQSFTVAGTCGMPATATAASLNLTGTGSTAQGNLRLFAAGTPAPLVSTLNYVAGQTRANNAVAPLGDGGQVSVLCSPSGTTHVVLDVNGYFQP